MIWDWASTIYLIVGGTITTLVSYGIAQGVRLINSKLSNSYFEGVLQRLGATIDELVAMVNQTLIKKIKAAKEPDSDGGTSLTETERAQAFNAVLDALKEEYGGWAGLYRLLKRIGISDKDTARKKITNMIEASVYKHKVTL